ncbi:MAG: hypothetical protein JNM72_23585 [Deltaproteobacteria bacterium]|nr:hypothetical protein [Deltaproteobacteria bacterium]
MHPIQCRCGALRGAVTPDGTSNRVRCFCTDCRAFVRHLGQGEAGLDAQGGVGLVHVAQARLRFTAGQEQLAALRLSPRGMLRWHTRCCGTPVGSTLADPKISFIGLNELALDRGRLDADFGAAVAQVNTDTALGAPKPAGSGLFMTMVRGTVIIGGARLSGAWRQSPLFDGAGAPVVPPVVLAKDEVARLKGMDGAPAASA